MQGKFSGDFPLAIDIFLLLDIRFSISRTSFRGTTGCKQ